MLNNNERSTAAPNFVMPEVGEHEVPPLVVPEEPQQAVLVFADRFDLDAQNVLIRTR